MNPYFVFSFLLVIAVCPLRAQDEEPTRAAFAHSMSLVTKGMTSTEVLKQVGKPDDIRTQYDPGGISTLNTTEIWCYGTAGHLTFPTLGCIYMSKGRVQYIMGGQGKPPDPAMFKEAELRKLLQLIDSAAQPERYNPLPFIRIVNSLQPLGKDTALACISEYLRVASSWDHSRTSLFLILRLLFEVPADTGFMPPMEVGMPSVANPADPKRVPLFPLVLVDDIPLDLVTGYMLAGMAEPVEEHVKYFQANGKLRAHPLHPSDNPLAALDKLEHSPQWIYRDKPGSDGYGRDQSFIANQLLSLIDTVYRIEPDENGDELSCCDFDPKSWNKIVKDVAALGIKWDPAKNIYVFAGGTSLPEVKTPIYKRQIWNLPQLSADAKLIIERANKNLIVIILQYSGHAGGSIPKSTVTLYPTGANHKPLAEFRVRSSRGENTYSETSQDAKLPIGESFQAEITFGNKATKSPVFTP
jgi:hypothetical protein